MSDDEDGNLHHDEDGHSHLSPRGGCAARRRHGSGGGSPARGTGGGPHNCIVSGCKRVERAGKDPQPSMPVVFGGFLVAMILAVIVRLGRAPQGPCVYHHAYRRSTCKVKSLSEIPQDVPDTIQALLMGDETDELENNFTSLARSNFTRFRHLQELALVHCGVEQIEAETFADLVQLKRLDLSHNRIRVLTDTAFRGLVDLDVLRLTNNPLHVLPEKLFHSLTIRLLVLANMTALERLDQRVFEGAKIDGLIISRSRLEGLEPRTWGLNPEYFKELSVSHNQLPLVVGRDAFDGYSLNNLVLRRNGITSVKFLQRGNHEVIILDGNPLRDAGLHLDVSSKKTITSETKNRTRVLSLSNTSISLHDKPALLFLFPNLEVLNVNDNDIDTFDLDLLSYFDRLLLVDLSKNQIKHFAGNFSSLAGSGVGSAAGAGTGSGAGKVVLHQLETLLLHDNDIETLPGGMEPLIRRLSVLSLQANSLHCNCELRWLRDVLLVARRQLMAALAPMTCVNADVNNVTQFADHSFKCNSPMIRNVSLDENGRTLLCTATGDPAPTVYWITPPGKTVTAGVPPPYTRTDHETTGRLTVVGPGGNYTCRAVNVAGEVQITVDTTEEEEGRGSGSGDGEGSVRGVESGRVLRKLTRRYVQDIEILTTPHGFLFTSILLVLLGYIFKHQ